MSFAYPFVVMIEMLQSVSRRLETANYQIQTTEIKKH